MKKLIDQFRQIADAAALYKDDAALARNRAFLQAAQMLEDYEPCERCDGSGLITIMDYDGYGSDADDQPCPECAAAIQSAGCVVKV